MTADWTQHKFEWLEAVAADRRARGVSLSVAVLLSLRYFNNRSKVAWPATATLAAAIKTDRRTVQRALNNLIQCGWLNRSRGGGKGRSNRYSLGRPKGGLDAALSPRQRAGYAPSNSGLDGLQTAGYSPPEPEKNPRGTRERVAASAAHAPSAPDISVHKTGRMKHCRQPLPDEWSLSEKEISDAEQITNWEMNEIADQFDAFQQWHRAQRPFSYDWSASWQNWCRKGIIFERRSKRPLTGVRSAISGLQEWLAEQEPPRDSDSAPNDDDPPAAA